MKVLQGCRNKREVPSRAARRLSAPPVISRRSIHRVTYGRGGASPMFSPLELALLNCVWREMGKKQKKRDEAEESVQPSKRACTHKQPLIVFAHGAGAPSSSEWMIRWKELLSSSTGAVDVVTFDYPYCAGGKKGAPPKAEKLITPHTEEIRKAQSKYPGHPLVLVGKSMGSRVACMVAGQGEVGVSAIVCLGYPLKGTTGALRDETLLNLRVPVMFVQGSKDGLCPLDKLHGVLEKMASPTKLHVIEGGDHSFKVGKKNLKEQGVTQENLDGAAAESIQAFLQEALETAS